MRQFINRLTANRPLFAKILIASFLVNILALATPIYVIQVLQRYVAYGVTSTLITLVAGITFIVIFEFFFRNIRHRMAREYELKNVLISNQVLDKLTIIKSQFFEIGSKLRNDIINKNLTIIQNVYSASNLLLSSSSIYGNISPGFVFDTLSTRFDSHNFFNYTIYIN